LKLHILPSAFLSLDENEKAFVVASIRKKTEEDAKKEKELAAKRKRR